MKLTWNYLFAGVIVALFARSGLGAPPRIRSHFPAAGARGVDTRLQVLGQGLGPGAKLLLPFAAEVRFEHGSGEQAFFTLKPAKDISPGVYPVRVQMPSGLSNMVLFAVTDLPVVREVEPNGRLAQAQRVEWPCLIVGSMGGQGAPHPSKDVDLYRFSVKKGERLTLVTETQRLGLTPDLLIRLRGPDGRELTHNDDTPGLGVDARLDYTFREAGEYLVEVHLTEFNYYGRNFSYLLKIGNFDYARSVFPLGGRRGEKLRLTVTGRDGQNSHLDAQAPADPWAEEWRLPLPDHPGSLPWRLALGDWPEVMEDAGLGGPQKVAWPTIVNGRIAKPEEVDRFRLAVKPGQKVRARVDASYLGSALCGLLRAYDPAGKRLSENHGRRTRMEVDPLLDFVVPENVQEVTLTLEDCFGRGGIDYPYRLTLEPGGPDFELSLGIDFPGDGKAQNDVLHLPVGKAVALPVRVLRRDYDGPIKLIAMAVPAGITVQSGEILAAKNSGAITLAAGAQAPPLTELRLFGEAKIDGQTLRRKVIRPLHLAQPYFTNLPWDWRLTRVLCCKVAENPGK